MVTEGVWGAPFGTADGAGWETADDAALRGACVGIGAAVSERRIVTAPSGPTALYRASGPDGEAYATHAVAAAWLAFGEARVDVDALPELLAFDFPGGERTLIEGVSPVPPATAIEHGVARSWWPAAERWAPVPEDEAHAHAERALLETLAARVGDDAVLMLTAGADSRVLALALAELGRPFGALVWGEEGWREVVGARAVAEHVGAPLERRSHWRSDAELRARFDAEARWTDGVLALSPSERLWPDAAGAVVFGAAGEVGRAFYHRAGGRSLIEALAPEARLPGAPREVAAAVRASAEGWLAQAERVADGWRALDVLYAEQRVARWGRGQVPALAAVFVGGFCPVEVMRGLSSLPLAERRADAFHRRFVADRAPALGLPAPPPVSARRGRRPGWARPRRSVPPPPGDPFVVGLWSDRPESRAWVCDEALGPGSPAERAMGPAWCASTRDGFLRGERRTTEQALLAAGPAALETGLRELRL